jgi:hypothetical protein
MTTKNINRITPREITKFVTESNLIEDIHRPPTAKELREFRRFLELQVVTVEELEHFVSIYQPGAILRERAGLDVRVAGYLPPLGGPDIRKRLKTILLDAPATSAWRTHIQYELLHPFTDCNGRSGRAVWAWQMGTFPIGFLHRFYYQTLAFSR